MGQIIEEILPQMSDLDVDVEVYNKETGLLEDLDTDISNVVIVVYHANGTILAKFSVVSSGGYEPIIDTDAAEGKVSFRLTSAVTKLAPLGKYFYEVLVQRTDGSLSDGEYDRIETGVYLCTIVKSISAGLTLP